MKLAWRSLTHDYLRFIVTIIGIAFATLLMMFQGSLVIGFVRTSSLVIDATDSDIWVTAKGIPCFDYSAPLPRRFREIALGISGIESVQLMASGFAIWQKPSGEQQVIGLVGAEPTVGGSFPLPYINNTSTAVFPESVVIDRSTMEVFGVHSAPLDVQINGHRARVAKITGGFGTYLGNPYVYTNYDDAIRYIGLETEQTRFLLARIAKGYDKQRVKQKLIERFPEATVWTREEFARRSQLYWLIQTGAGGALLTAGLLGFVVGLVIVSQNIYATTMENIEEFATLKAIGAPRIYLQKIVLTQALISGFFGCIIGLIVSYPIIHLTERTFINWIYTPLWLTIGIILASLLMCSLASIMSIRKAILVEPGRVFRA